MRSCLIFAVLIGCASEEKVTSYNSNPEATIVSHSATETFLEGYEITFQATVSDANHANNELSVKWSTDQREVCPAQAPETDGTTICTVRLEENETQIIAQVTDPEGASGIAQVDFTVTPSMAPEVNIVSPTADEQYYTDNQILFSATITDEEDPSSNLLYTWESSIDGALPSTVSANSDGLVEEYFTLSEGEHAITLSVVDLSGKTTTQNASIYVNGVNTAPSCGITAPNEGETFISGENINFIGNATDSEIDFTELEIMWRSDQDGDLGPGLIDSTGQVTFSTDALSSTTHNIQFEVKDELEAVCTDTVTISVGTPPILTMTSPLDSEVKEAGKPISFQGTLSDNEEESSSLLVSWYSDIDGEFSTQGANSNGNITLNTSILSPGFHNITITATDSIGLTDSHSLSLQVNTVPTPPTVVLTPDPANTTDNILALASGSTDDDGQNVIYQYEWLINGQTTGITSANLYASNTQKGDLCTVRVTPNDGYSDGNFTDTSIIISNAPPVINTHSISPSAPNSLDTVTCNVGITEEDGDTLQETYTWTNDTTGATIGSSQSIDLSPSTVSPGDTISCSYTVDDGSENDSSSVAVTISNTGPVVNSVTVVPSVAVIGDTISCVMDVSDPDQQGYTESYLWTNDSTGATIGSSQDLTLTESMASPNDVVTCSGSAVDPQGGSGSGSGSLTLGNQEPTIDSITFSDETPVVGDTVECIAEVSDPDGDALATTFEWTDENGTVLATTAELFLDPSLVGSDDELTCSVTVDDGFGGVISDNSSLTLSNTAPEITDLVISNEEPVTSETLTCTVTATDADGDALTEEYTWVNETTGITIGSGDTLTLSPLNTQPGDSVRCDVTVADDSGEASDSVYAIVQNSAPTVTDVQIAPNPLYINSTVGCSATVDEPDLESTTNTYQWVNTDQNTIIANTQSFVLTSALASPQETIECTVTATDPAGDSGSFTTSLSITNQEPVISSVTFSDENPALDDTVECFVAATDEDGDILTSSFEWTDENGSVLATTAELFLDSSLLSGGDQITCSVTVDDGFGGTDMGENQLTIANTAPEITNVTIDNQTPTTSDTLICSVTTTDADGNTLTEEYAWVNESTGATLGTGNTITLSPLNTQPGDSIRCDVTVADDSDTASGSSYVIIQNSAPTVTDAEIAPNPLYINSTVSCTGTIEEPDLESTTNTFQWVNTDQNTIIANTQSFVLTSALASPQETIECTVTATDPAGEEGSFSTSLIVDNQSPEITSLSLDASTVALNETITCTATASDPEGDVVNITYEWTNDTSGQVIATSAALTLDATMGTGGDNISCTVTATDSYSASSTESVTITVDGSEPVFDTEAYITPSTGVDTGTTLTCSGLASDPDGGAVTLAYTWTNDTQSTTLGSNTSLTLTPTTASPTDIISCLITATDTSGDEVTSSSSVSVINQAPTLSNIAISPSSTIQTDTSLSCSVDLLDPDEEGLSVTYAWTNDTQSTTLGSSDSITLTPSLVQPSDVVRCTASIADNYGATDSEFATVTVGNFDPVISVVAISPDPAYNSDSLSCAVTATDADSQTLTESYTWTNTTTGASLGTGSSVSINSNVSSRGDVITCDVTVTDGSSASASSSATITLGNRAPNAPTVALSPDPAYIDSTLTCTPTGTDPDGDTVTYSYAWSIDGTPTTDTSSTLSAAFAAGETVQCTVTPNDGLLDGSTGSSSVTISNTAPSVDSITLSPDPVTTTQDLTATVTSSDLDGDTLTLTYDWYVNGSLIQSDVTNTFSSSNFIKNQTVELIVSASDGSDTDSSTTSIVVSNTAPQAPTISLSPAVPVEGIDALVCSVSTASVDVDSDTVTYTFSWTVDTVNYTSATDTATSSTVSAADTAADEIWECTITPNDGDEEGAAAATSVTIESDWQGAVTFTNCSQTGPTGPSQTQCDNAYSGTDLSGEVTLNSGIQQWVVPSSGTYTIEAYGAAGGDGSDGSSTLPGKGARMKGTFSLTQGDTIDIIVGQKGLASGGGGGGGGSFIWVDGSSTPLLVAGGGGGSGDQSQSSNYNGVDGTTSTSGTNSRGNASSGGSNGNGGGASSGSGGGGWSGNGSGSYGGKAALNGGAGGNWSPVSGGFGGGGANGSSSTDSEGGGGGGGYSGGGGGNSSQDDGGGGGGSFNAGSNQSNTAGANSGHGSVIIDKL